MKKFIFAPLFLSIFAMAQSAPAPRAGWSFFNAGLTPIQSGGRIKPLDTFARETALFVTGSRKFQGWQPLEMIFSWVTSPRDWRSLPFIQVSRLDVRRQLNLDEKRTYFSPEELLNNFSLVQYAQRMGTASQVPDPKGISKANAREQELRRVLDRLGLFQGVVTGDAIAIVPMPAPHPWMSLARMEEKTGQDVRSNFLKLFHGYLTGDRGEFSEASNAARASVEGKVQGWSDGMRRVLYAEALYQKLRPFLVAWILYLAAALFWAVGRLSGGGPFWGRIAAGSMSLAFLSHVSGIAARCYIAGRPPVTNMYESIIWVSLGVVIFSWILFALHRQQIALLVACAVATLGLIAADAAPTMMDPGLHPLVPVLRSNYWLTIHVLTITLGYAALALTLGLANVTLFHFARRAPGFAAKTETLNQLTYRAMQFGVVFLAAGTILGGVWADYSWGRFWGWDPKEVWALIALLCYLAILHGRFAGWVGQLGFATWTVVSFLSVLMAWYGVNFVLGVGLHSYGFSSGGLGWISSFVAVELLYVVVAVVSHRRGLRRG